MATQYSFGKVVTNGLVLSLDAADRNSYPGSGTTWRDMSGNRTTATLVNSPTFSTNNGGYFSFDGGDDYVEFTAVDLGTTATVEILCKIKSTISSMIFGWLRYDVFCSNGSIGYNTFSSNDVYGLSSSQVTTLDISNNWKHFIFEMRSDVSYINNKIYVNGISQSLAQIAGTENTSNRNFNNGLGEIASTRETGFGGYYMNMDCSYFRVYNRSLTQSEILQNYQAQKSRFGL